MSLLLTSSSQSHNNSSGSHSSDLKNTIVHLRFPFSFLLMPVYLFALSQTNNVNIPHTILAFFIIHVLVFPSSNGYNSYHDKDTSSIGLIKNPPKVSKNLLRAANLMDILAVITGLLVSFTFSLLITIFILISRAYSNREIRLKRFPLISFFIVAFFQGGYLYMTSVIAISDIVSVDFLLSRTMITCMVISTLFIGSLYPLTQIYQHESDKRDGVITLSYLLGYIGTFIFSSSLFMIASTLIYVHFYYLGQQFNFHLFIFLMTPVILFITYWSYKVYRNIKYASFQYTMVMNIITALAMNTYFTLIILK